jgi:hypothetical protein
MARRRTLAGEHKGATRAGRRRRRQAASDRAVGEDASVVGVRGRVGLGIRLRDVCAHMHWSTVTRCESLQRTGAARDGRDEAVEFGVEGGKVFEPELDSLGL